MKKINLIFIIVLSFLINIQLALADVWLAPPANPPNSNRPRPVDTGDLTQSKIGGLTVQGALTASGGLTVQSASNFSSLATFTVGINATNAGVANAIYGYGAGHGVYGESSGSAYAGIYGRNTGAGWAGYFQGPTGLSSYIVVGGLANPSYINNGDAYFYDDLGTVGDLTVGGGLSTYDTIVADNTLETGQLCLGNGLNCITAWSQAGSSVWTTSGNNIYNNNVGNVGIGTNNPALGKLQLRNGDLVLDNYSLIRQVADSGSSPVLINDQLMVGRRYDVGCGHYCGNGVDLGVDLADNENLIFGRVKANPTGTTNQNLLRLQQGNGTDAQIDKFKVDLSGNTTMAGNLDVNGTAILGSAGLNVANGQNLLYGNIDSASQGNLIVLQNENVNQFVVTAGGGVNLNGNLIFYKVDNAYREISIQTQTSANPGTGLKIYAGSANQSFAGETKINTLLGLIEIKDLRIGDKVLSYNPDSKKYTEAEVRKIFSHQAESYYLLNGYLKVTAKHPFYTQAGWKKVKELTGTDMLFTINGWQKLDSKKLINEKLFVYNLQVDQPNTYFAEGILVHNKAPVDGGSVYIYGGSPAGVGEGLEGNVILGNTGSGVRGKVIIGNQQAWPQGNVLDVYGSAYIGTIDTTYISASGNIKGNFVSQAGAACADTQILKKVSGSWTCSADVGGGAGDNLGNHTATQNIQLGSYWLSGDGGNEGVYVNASGDVGIGTNNPTTKLEVNGNIKNAGVTLGDNGNAIINGWLEVGGGYGSTGVTLSSAGNISANGNIVVDGTLANPNDFFIDGDGNVQIRIDKNNNGTNYFNITNGANVTVLQVNESGDLIFEGFTNDVYETNFVVADPTASDKTITFPNLTGTVSLFGLSVDSGEITDGTISTTDILDGTIAAADLANYSVLNINIANNAVTTDKISDGTIGLADIANSVINGGKLTNDITLAGDLTVGGNDIKPNDGGAGGAAIQFNNGNVIIRLGQ